MDTSASDGAVKANILTVLPAPSSPSSVVRRKMASNASNASTAPRKDAVPPRRPAASTATASVRRPAAGNASAASTAGTAGTAGTATSKGTTTTTNATTATSKPPASSTSRLAPTGSSLSRPPARPAPGTTARRTGLSSRPAHSDAEPDLSSVTSGEENRKPAVRRTLGGAGPTATTRTTPASDRRSTITPSTTPAAKRPAVTSRPSADHTTTRATPRASLAASTAKLTPTRPTAATRTPHHIIPKAPVSTITPKTPVSHAKKLSISSASSPSKPSVADAPTYSPIDVPPRSSGPLKDKAASDAEVEVRKTIPFGPLKAGLPKVGEEDRRPGTAPSGPAAVDEESKRRSIAVMQDFFKETSRREKLQEQCDDLNREVDRLHASNTKLKKQLVDAHTAVAEKERAVAAAGGDSTGWDENKHNTIVNGMEKKFALETKLLEEQKQKLGEEKRIAQEKEAVEAAKAAELQQVLDDLNVELERQGREWDAEKLQLVEQSAKIEALTMEMAGLKEERNTLLSDLATATIALESLQMKLSDLDERHSDEVHARDGKIDALTKTVEALRSEVTAAEQRRNDVSEEAKRPLEDKSSESSAIVEELQAKVTSLQQRHTEELHQKEEAMASHLQIEEELRDDIVKLQQRADQTTAALESERTAHAESVQAKIAELQQSSQNDLKMKEADITGHLKSIEDLQNKITSLQQGETDGARASQELTEQIDGLKAAHDEAIKLKTEQNEELVQQLQAINEQLSSDASEIEHLREEADGLRKTVESLEQVAQQDSAKHATTLQNLQTELSEAKKKADSYKADIETAKDRHRQDLRVLGEDHEGEIDSLRADLEGDAKKRLDKLQAEYDSLVAEKNAALQGHEKSLADRAKELEETHQELATIKERSGSTSQGLDEAIAKHKQVLEEKTALAEAHYTAQKQIAELENRIEVLTEENALIEQLQARLDASTEDKLAANEALAISQKSFTHLTEKLDALDQEKQSIEDERVKSEQIVAKLEAEAESLNQEKQALEKQRTDLQNSVTDLTTRYDALANDKTAMEEAHAHTIDALKQDSEGATKQVLNELQSKYDALLEDKRGLEDAHTAQLRELQTKYDTVANALTDAKKQHEDSLVEHAAVAEAHGKAIDHALDAQRAEIEQKHAALIEEVQSEASKLKDEKATALAEKQSAVEELDRLKRELNAQIDELRHELVEKEEIDSAGLVEVSKKYEMLLAEQSTADRDAHEADVEALRRSLSEEYERAKQEAYDEIENLRHELELKERSDSAGLVEVTEKYESLLSEQSAADKRDHEATMALFKVSADTDLSETKERYEALLAEKDSLKDEYERARDDAYAEMEKLRQELTLQERVSSAGLAEVTQKYEALLAEKSAADDAHEVALSSLKHSLESEHAQVITELQAHNSALQGNLLKMEQEHQDKLVQMKEEIEASHSVDSKAMLQQLESAQKQHADATEQMVKAHEDAVSDMIIGMQNNTADAVQKVQKRYDALEAQIEAERASHAAELQALSQDRNEQQTAYHALQSQHDKTVAELEASCDDTRRLQDIIQVIEADRDRAYRGVQEAEDRIETLKGEVVRKHLAVVEPLKKEIAVLQDKIDRLKDMLAASDRITRAAASMGEKRAMTTLAEQEEEEEEEDSAASAGSAHGVPREAPPPYATAKDVFGTFAAMQETISQLNALNNDIIVENGKTAQRLTMQD